MRSGAHPLRMYLMKRLTPQHKRLLREIGRMGAEKTNAAKTPEERRESARKAAQARWKKAKKSKKK